MGRLAGKVQESRTWLAVVAKLPWLALHEESEPGPRIGRLAGKVQ
jgi:hypothetical protein